MILYYMIFNLQGRIPQPGPPQPTAQPQTSQAAGVNPEPGAEQGKVFHKIVMI